MSESLLEVRDLHRAYHLPRTRLFSPPPSVQALRGVSLAVAPGESFGVVGESGCGKSTLARTVVALEAPDRGEVWFRGSNLFGVQDRELRRLRRQIQMVFQDPYGSLDPRRRVGKIVAEPLYLMPELDALERRERVLAALAEVGLKPLDAEKYPREFSGGQRQRIAIARALITRPALIVADEPVSALDVSVQAQVLNLMLDLQERQGLSYLFISHDLSVVRHITDRVAVMRAGQIVEQGLTREVFARPCHDYTRQLLAAIPRPEPGRRRGR